MAGERCECCGSPLPEYGGIIADDERHEIRFNGKRLGSLTSQEWNMFRFLLDKKGRIATKKAILEFLYQLRPDGGEDIEPKIIDVFACKLRKKLAPLGLHIGTSWGRGYYLEEPSVTKEESIT
jgi:DNA-binding response OmpR family regulator